MTAPGTTTAPTADVEWIEEWLWDDLRKTMEGREVAMETIVVDVTHALDMGVALPMAEPTMASPRRRCYWRHVKYQAKLVDFTWHDGKALATYDIEVAE